MTAWAIVKGSTTVTLPIAPRVIDESYPTKNDEVGVDGGGTVLVSRFMQSRKLKLQGSFYVSGYTNSQYESTYLAPLRGMLRQTVTVTDPDSQWSGNWIFTQVDFHREAEGAAVRYTYTLTFMQGVTIVTL
jgi:hypothetical protein